MTEWYDAKVVKPPKFKKIVLSYDAHAKHFIQEAKKKIIDTAPEKVFEGYSSRKSNKKVKEKVRTPSQTNIITNKKKIKKKKKK